MVKLSFEYKGRNILIVEDSTLVALQLQKYLEKKTMNVVGCVTNGADAIKIAEKNKIDLALMDIKLKGKMDGIETATILNNKFKVPIVYLTAHSDEDTFERAKKTNPFGYLLKPFEEEDVNTTIQLAIHHAYLEKQRAKSEELYKNLVECSRDGIMILQDNAIVFCNASLPRMLGYEIDQVIGKNINEIVTPEYHSFIDEFLKKELFEKSLYKELDLELAGKEKDKKIFVGVNFSRLQYHGENAIMATVKDITEKKNAEKILIEAKEKAEKSDSLKSEFLSQISHEVRTPVHIILGYLHLLKEEIGGSVSENLKESFSIIDKAGVRLVRTIDLIVEMAMLQSGNYELHPEDIELEKDIINNIIKENISVAEKKGLALSYKNSAEGVIVKADKRMMSILFSNLLDNAIKFTNKGNVNMIQYLNKEKRLTVEIRDTGIGISQEYLKEGLKPFSQEESGYKRSFDGNGLGLAVVKKIAELNHTSFNINSTKNKGTSITLTF